MFFGKRRVEFWGHELLHISSHCVVENRELRGVCFWAPQVGENFRRSSLPSGLPFKPQDGETRGVWFGKILLMALRL